MKIAVGVLLGFAFLSTRLHPQKASPQTTSARRSFQELLDAQDESVTKALAASHAYVCFEDGKDEFLLASFRDPPGPWLPLAGPAKGKSAEGRASLQQFVKGANDPQGVSIDVAGQWQRLQSSPDSPNFSGTNRETGTANPIGGSVTIDYNQFDVVENYLNADHSQVEYRFTLRRSTGRFSEIYRVASKNEPSKSSEDSGYCVIYRDGISTTPDRQPTVSAPAKR